MNAPTPIAIVLSSIFLSASAVVAVGQEVPTSQPNVLLIQIESIKLGHDGAHAQSEAGWPAAYARANTPDAYLAFASITGTSQVWFVSAYDSHKAMEEATKRDNANAELSAELGRLSRADAEHLTGFETLHAVARNDLSHGAFPDPTQHRFWEITTFRLRPGGDTAFAEAAKAYGAASGRVAPDASFRIYEVVAGSKSPTYFVFSSTVSVAEFDKARESYTATMNALNAQEQEAMAKFAAAAIDVETQRFRLSPGMSYVSREVRERDPAFWMPNR